MIVVLMLRIRMTLKSQASSPDFFTLVTAVLYPGAEGCQCLLQYLLVCSQIEQSRNGHIPADSAPALQI